MRILQLMDNQVRVLCPGGNTPKSKIAERVANVHGPVRSHVHAARTDQGYMRLIEWLRQTGQRHVVRFRNHGAGIPLVDGLPQAGAQLVAGLSWISLLGFSGFRHESTLRTFELDRSAGGRKAAQGWTRLFSAPAR